MVAFLQDEGLIPTQPVVNNESPRGQQRRLLGNHLNRRSEVSPSHAYQSSIDLDPLSLYPKR